MLTPVRQRSRARSALARRQLEQLQTVLTLPDAEPTTPNPQSQSFSRSYGSILPTSLIYIVLSTRGCSPWRPDAVMSTTRRANKSFPRIFKDRRERTGHLEKYGAFPAIEPYLRIIQFQGRQTVKKKRELFPGLPPASPSSLMLPYNIHILVQEY